MNAVGAGDKVWVKASANYTETATIDTAGGNATPITFEGYTTATGDGGRATIDGGGARANCINDSLGVGTDIYYIFKNFRMTAATGIGFSTDCDFVTFKNCKFDTNGAQGLLCRLVTCEACEFTSNASSGVSISGSGGGVFVGCTFYSNTGTGLLINDGPFAVLYCTFFSNGSYGIGGAAGNTLAVIVNCTIDGDAKDSNAGARLNSLECLTAIVNTVAYDCSTGIENNAGDMGERMVSRNNCVNANTADYNNVDTFTGEVTAAPNFVNEVAGADYTPDTGSPLIEAGYDIGENISIGAIQLAAAGDAGGLLMPNKRGNKQ